MASLYGVNGHSAYGYGSALLFHAPPQNSTQKTALNIKRIVKKNAGN
jgi:hypothetical protein